MRLIDADALFYKLYNTNPATEGHFGDGVVQAMGFILNAPTIDAVPVVRCKDCKHGEIDDPDFPSQYYCHSGCGWNKDDFYCAYGERKTDGEDSKVL